MGELYVTYLERPTEDKYYNRYDGYNNPFVLHNGWQWHLGRFPHMEALMQFMQLAELEMELVEQRETHAGLFMRWSVGVNVDDNNGFWSVSELPKGAKKFKGLSNGSLVDCYLINDGVLHIYRPNPNAKNVYKPLSISEHIAFCKANGYV